MTKEDDVRAAQRAVSKAEAEYNRIKLNFRSTREEIDIAHEALTDAGMWLQRATKALQEATRLTRPLMTEADVHEMMQNPAVRKLAEKLQYFKAIAFQCDYPWEAAQARLDALMPTATVPIFSVIDQVADTIKREFHHPPSIDALIEEQYPEGITDIDAQIVWVDRDISGYLLIGDVRIVYVIDKDDVCRLFADERLGLPTQLQITRLNRFVQRKMHYSFDWEPHPNTWLNKEGQ
jgi:hypothetical protein